MSLAFALTALVMGVAGGPHCIAMCGAPSAAIIHFHPQRPASGAPAGAMSSDAGCASAQRGLLFHLGRLSGYAGLGAVAGGAVQGLGWMATQSQALRPAWTLMHLAVLAWGLMLLVLARQPLWVHGAGQRVWQRVRPFTASDRGVWAAGAMWALLPCGLLYSALLVASLSGGPLRGAISMAMFGVGSALSLAAGPWLWRWLRAHFDRAQASNIGTRAAGAVLAGAALWALWMDFSGRLADWCAA